jgi:predicted HicB family RNase H-like nuclease
MPDMNHLHYTYRVAWSGDDDEFVATVAELPSLSWLAESPGAAVEGLAVLVGDVVADLEKCGERVPVPLIDRAYSGRFQVRVPPDLHRRLVVEAAEQRVSLNRLVSDRLSHAS